METRTCGKCNQYSRGLLRCLISKVNPRTKKGTNEVARIMGWSAVCSYSKWKQQRTKKIHDTLV